LTQLDKARVGIVKKHLKCNLLFSLTNIFLCDIRPNRTIQNNTDQAYWIYYLD